MKGAGLEKDEGRENGRKLT